MNHAMRSRQVFSDNARREAESSAVRACDCLVFIVENKDAHHGTEDFFAHDAHVVVAPGEDSGFDVLASREMAVSEALAARDQTRAVLQTAFYIAEHLLQLRGADQWAEVGVSVSGRACADALHPCEH